MTSWLCDELTGSLAKSRHLYKVNSMLLTDAGWMSVLCPHNSWNTTRSTTFHFNNFQCQTRSDLRYRWGRQCNHIWQLLKHPDPFPIGEGYTPPQTPLSSAPRYSRLRRSAPPSSRLRRSPLAVPRLQILDPPLHQGRFNSRSAGAGAPCHTVPHVAYADNTHAVPRQLHVDLTTATLRRHQLLVQVSSSAAECQKDWGLDPDLNWWRSPTQIVHSKSIRFVQDSAFWCCPWIIAADCGLNLSGWRRRLRGLYLGLHLDTELSMKHRVAVIC